jgi:hypothetical protein
VRLGPGLKKCSCEFTSSAPDLDASHLQDVLELRGVLHLDLEEEDRDFTRDVVVLALLLLLQPVLVLVARLAPIGDEVDLALMAGLFYEPLGRLVEFYALLPELERAIHPREDSVTAKAAELIIASTPVA